MLGIPALSLPVLSVEGLPLGLQIMGFGGQDAGLFSIGAAVRDLLGAMQHD
jgi:Asp-tRNA(Asn)/Glu-tRNA(Gln) amidotransferase A subunit family amidase